MRDETPKPTIRLIPGQHIHFVGIGGAGLSAIARILLQQGFYVSGSDMNTNEQTDALARDGARIYRGHDAMNVKGAEMVIVSSAVSIEHIEVLSAHAQGIPVLKRADMIAALTQGHVGIAIAGTHGKTTTTAMTVHILRETGLDPSYIVGGMMNNTGTNAGVGKGGAFVIEADEYDNMFHGLRPQIEVVTNIEFDHPDFFATPNDLVESFSSFIALLAQGGLLVACADDPTTLIFANNRRIVNLPVATYSIRHPHAMWRARQIRLQGDKTLFEVWREGQRVGEVTLIVPGEHNVLNALASLIVADAQGINFELAANALSTYTGTDRRFSIRADVNRIAVIDDYAHHPSAIRATIAATRARYPDREVWVVWQPHTYTRTRHFFDDFVSAFDGAHHVAVLPIYGARERDPGDLSGADVVRAMSHPHALYIDSFATAVSFLQNEVHSPAVVLILSAGDAPLIGQTFLGHKQGTADA